MRAVFVNQCHPETPHVCAVRLRGFARALAAKGHQIVLLTECLADETANSDAQALADRLTQHRWDQVFHVGCRPAAAPFLVRLHDGRLPWGLRQATVAASFVFAGGVFAHWRRASGSAVGELARSFRPEIVWGTFGITDAWNIARDLARMVGCPWVADLKDNWNNFIPFGLRGYLAGRYRDVAHMTALSDAHASIGRSRFGLDTTTVYSGFPLSALQRLVPDPDDGAFRIVSAGSIYNGEAFKALIVGIAGWLSKRTSNTPVEFLYCGGDDARVAALTAPLAGRCKVDVRPFVAVDELNAHQRRATVNIYPRYQPMLFHHKFIECLSASRPIICLPGETAESRRIAEETGIALFSCDAAGEVETALDAIAGRRWPRVDASRLARYSWEQQADVLARVLASARDGDAKARS